MGTLNRTATDHTQLVYWYMAPYRNTVIGTLAADGWAVTFGTARRGLGGAAPCPCLPRCISVPITVLLYNGPLLCGFNVRIRPKGLLGQCTRTPLGILDSGSTEIHASTAGGQ